MEIIKAETAGFCFGVDRAVKMTYKLLEEGHKVCTLGPLIHNPQCVQDLKAKGAISVDAALEVPKD
ncbi:MAG: 4-hydroxy-3-methylbut-2-enyl diphosphate reductase, partial [Oscillospiraceae bacterium]